MQVKKQSYAAGMMSYDKSHKERTVTTRMAVKVDMYD